jgi:hypothetical protein
MAIAGVFLRIPVYSEHLYIEEAVGMENTENA